MIHKRRKVEIAENVALRCVYCFCDLWSLLGILCDLLYLLYQKVVVAGVLNIAISTWEYLGRIPNEEAAKIFGEDFHAVRLDELNSKESLLKMYRSNSLSWVWDSHTLWITSAWASHFALPSFSVIEPSSRKTWVTTILDTEDWPNGAEEEFRPVADRSKVLVVGELRLCCGNGGDKVWCLKLPPPPLLPPPPA